MVQDSKLDWRIPEDIKCLLLSKKHSQRVQQRATKYAHIKVFGNYFQVEDETTSQLVSYNNGIASMFELPLQYSRDLSLNCIGVFKDIL